MPIIAIARYKMKMVNENESTLQNKSNKSTTNIAIDIQRPFGHITSIHRVSQIK